MGSCKSNLMVRISMFGLPVLMSHNQWISCEKRACVFLSLFYTRKSKSLFHITGGSTD